ncbi:nucleotide-diphospho-sugar transferase [Maribacter algarum]|uniref:Nucleotide-diphospho-sugar transferase n=1 Tax=Maribacter algarum (ex Zhang et al. 2020) TaxID=2578118 RepID=A0A5S3PMY2_9FLAO|nr:nucleotide-diphospho-sugar transferase [Maribacter algarum]TMM53786.1 nucleotide-diphospho-sugar transferase [Maribacter algarum]
MDQKNLKTPVLFIVFNRLDTTKRVFEEIRRAKPSKLYVACDGARKNNPDDVSKIDSVREFVLNNVDWDCEVKKLFSNENIGCKYGPQKAITWFFEHEEEGIILEDDCVPSRTFFKYCEELLEYHRKDLRVFAISGTNYLRTVDIPNSYYFSQFLSVCGWAGWRDRWQKHLYTLNNFNDILSSNLIHNNLRNKVASKMLVEFAKKSFEDGLDAWDFQWHFTCIINNGLLIVPKENLIQNIGFGPDATHTNSSEGRILPNYEVNFPLDHPKLFTPELEFDDRNFWKFFGWTPMYKKISSPKYIYAVIKSRLSNLVN